MALEINEIYTVRSKLHRQVYQHRIANVAEAMITDLLEAANHKFRFKGPDGKPQSLVAACRKVCVCDQPGAMLLTRIHCYC